MNIRKILINVICSVIPGKQRRKRIRNKLRSQVSQKLIHVSLSDRNFVNDFSISDRNILSVLRNLGKFQYVVNPGNLGDCLIEVATYQFFERYGLMDSITDDKSCEHIVYAGGAPWVENLYPEACLPALSLFEKARKIVLLPCSVFNCPMLTDALDSRYVVFCRERKTYEYLKGLKTGAELYLDFDMALRMDRSIFDFTFLSNDLYLEGALKVQRKIAHIGKVAYFFREDAEKYYNVETDLDLSAAFSPKMTIDGCKFAVALMLSVVDQFDIVVTDRLHVGIAAILMNKTVYLFDNSYGKISSVYEHSFRGMSNVHLCREKDLIKIKKLKESYGNNFEDLLSALLN